MNKILHELKEIFKRNKITRSVTLIPHKAENCENSPADDLFFRDGLQ